MPGAENLTWTEIAEFGSLWTTKGTTLASANMPPNAATIMSGCHPQPGGGLRAFYAPTGYVAGEGLSYTGGGSSANEQVAGLAVFPREPNAAFSDLSVPRDDFLVMTHDPVTSNPLPAAWNLWARRTAEPDAAWTRVTTTAPFAGLNSAYGLGTVPRQSFFTAFPTGTAGSLAEGYAFMANTCSAAGSVGPYTFDFGALTCARLPALPTFSDAGGPMTLHQGRLVFASNHTIWFTRPNTTTVDATNFIGLGGARTVLGLITWMVAVPPSDLIVGTGDGRVFSIQGDLADPIVRELGTYAESYTHLPILTPRGIAVMLPGGVFLAGTDGGWNHLSQPIDPAAFGSVREPDTDGTGALTFTQDYLFTPNYHGAAADAADVRNTGPLVYDFRTNAWFTSTHPDQAIPGTATTAGTALHRPKFLAANRNFGSSGVYVATTGVTHAASVPVVTRIQTGSTRTEAEVRNSVFEWQSAPLRAPDGRTVNLREIVLQAGRCGTGTISLSVVTPTGTVTRTFVSAGVDQQFFRAQFNERAEAVQVRIKCVGSTATTEAPSIESVRFGWRPGHRLYG